MLFNEFETFAMCTKKFNRNLRVKVYKKGEYNTLCSWWFLIYLVGTHRASMMVNGFYSSGFDKQIRNYHGYKFYIYAK